MATGSGKSVRQALHEAGGESSFHYMCWGYFVCDFPTAFVMMHLPSLPVDAGFTANVGMTAVALIGLFNIFGSFFFGWGGGRYSKKNLLSLIWSRG